MDSEEPRDDADSQATPPADDQPTEPSAPDDEFELITHDRLGNPLDQPYMARKGTRKGRPRNGRWPVRAQHSIQGRRNKGACRPFGAWKQAFLEAYAKYGNNTTAARIADVSLSAVNLAKKSDPAFAEAVAECHEMYVDSLREELHHQIFEGDWKYTIVDGKRTKLQRQKQLLALFFELKKRDPSYRDNYQGDAQAATGQAVAQAIIQVLGISPDGSPVTPITIESKQEKIERLRRELSDAEAMPESLPQVEAPDADS